MKTTSTHSCAWLIRTAEEALAKAPPQAGRPHPWEPPRNAAAGVVEQMRALLLGEAFGIPEPCRDPIRYADLRM